MLLFYRIKRRENGRGVGIADSWQQGSFSTRKKWKFQRKNLKKIEKLARARFTSYSALKTYYWKNMDLGFYRLFPWWCNHFASPILPQALDAQWNWSLGDLEVFWSVPATAGRVSGGRFWVVGCRFRHGGTGVGSATARTGCRVPFQPRRKPKQRQTQKPDTDHPSAAPGPIKTLFQIPLMLNSNEIPVGLSAGLTYAKGLQLRTHGEHR